MIKKFRLKFKRHSDSVFRNLVEVLLQCMKLRDAAKKKIELDLLNLDMQETLKLDISKNLHIKHPIFQRQSLQEEDPRVF